MEAKSMEIKRKKQAKKEKNPVEPVSSHST